MSSVILTRSESSRRARRGGQGGNILEIASMRPSQGLLGSSLQQNDFPRHVLAIELQFSPQTRVLGLGTARLRVRIHCDRLSGCPIVFQQENHGRYHFNAAVLRPAL
jgi:hypothetical protein